jgi:hypothetical protein
MAHSTGCQKTALNPPEEMQIHLLARQSALADPVPQSRQGLRAMCERTLNVLRLTVCHDRLTETVMGMPCIFPSVPITFWSHAMTLGINCLPPGPIGALTNQQFMEWLGELILACDPPVKSKPVAPINRKPKVNPRWDSVRRELTYAGVTKSSR